MKDFSELIKDLGHKDYSVRQNAIESLGTLGDEKAIEPLTPIILKDKNKFVRRETINALKKIGGEKAVEALTQALKEEKDEWTIEMIKKALANLQGQ